MPGCGRCLRTRRCRGTGTGGCLHHVAVFGDVPAHRDLSPGVLGGVGLCHRAHRRCARVAGWPGAYRQHHPRRRPLHPAAGVSDRPARRPDIFAQVHGHGPTRWPPPRSCTDSSEAIHPLPDGNGRAGRAVLAQALWRSGAGGSPTVFLARHREDYIAALVAFTGTPAPVWRRRPATRPVAQATLGLPLPDPRTPVTRDEDCAAQGGYTRVDSDIWMLTELWESAHAVRSAVVGHL